MVCPALLPLMGTPRLPVVDWTDVPADLNGLVRFSERRSLVSSRVSSHFKRSTYEDIQFNQFTGCNQGTITVKCVWHHKIHLQNIRLKCKLLRSYIQHVIQSEFCISRGGNLRGGIVSVAWRIGAAPHPLQWVRVGINMSVGFPAVVVTFSPQTTAWN
jgi:hypothetical protein